jgi:hypothetical protein
VGRRLSNPPWKYQYDGAVCARCKLTVKRSQLQALLAGTDTILVCVIRAECDSFAQRGHGLDQWPSHKPVSADDLPEPPPIIPCTICGEAGGGSRCGHVIQVAAWGRDAPEEHELKRVSLVDSAPRPLVDSAARAALGELYGAGITGDSQCPVCGGRGWARVDGLGEGQFAFVPCKCGGK